MKKILLLAAALFATSSAFAVDLYVVGNDVNGDSDWNSKANKMNETSTNVFEWTGAKLGPGFKINNGGWDDDNYNIGMGADKLKLGEAIKYATGGASQNFQFYNFAEVTNAKIVLNMNAGTITLTGDAELTEPEPEPEEGWYIIGSDVNGKSWALAESDALFEDLGNGIYRWSGEKLGTGFKINDGTWSNEIAGTGEDIEMNVPYQYVTEGGANIGFPFGYTLILNPVVELNTNEDVQTITIISGETTGESHWYIAGINAIYELDDNWVLSQVGSSNVYQRQIEIVETVGKCKISDTGWAHQYGTNFPEEVMINADNMFIELDIVNGEGGDVDYDLPEGEYWVIFDYDEGTLQFSNEPVEDPDDDAVETIAAANSATPVYYNLQGMKVNNPEKAGILIKVVNGKATKVVK